jgi:hypothetical protein
VAVAGDRGKMSSFPDPLELESLEGGEPDPSVFDRITAVPGELPDLALAAPNVDDPVSGLHPRAPADEPLPSFREPLPEEDLPPVLGRPPASSRQRAASPAQKPPAEPQREKAEESWKSTGPRPSAAKRPVLELELDDLDPHEPPPERRPDALEVSLPETRTSQPASRGREPVLPSESVADRLRAQPTLPARAFEQARDLEATAPPVAASWPAVAGPPSRPQLSPEVLDMRDRYATGDFTGALVVAEALLERTPDHEEARRCHDRCTDVLAQMYLARLGSLAQAVRVAVPADQIRWLSLDHRAGFLLSLIDGHSTIEELLDISGMPRLDALRILHGLLDQRVIALADRP